MQPVSSHEYPKLRTHASIVIDTVVWSRSDSTGALDTRCMDFLRTEQHVDVDVGIGIIIEHRKALAAAKAIARSIQGRR